MKKTYSPKTADINRKWHLLDATDQILGRLSVKIAKFLMGKDKVIFSRHLDNGDQVVVLNSEKIKLTGTKELDKLYHRHSGYGGGYKKLNVSQVRMSHPDRLLKHAVSGMLPKNKLRAKMLTRLHLLIGSTNPYEQYFKS
jgi:large subunit ribosomal protein L13